MHFELCKISDVQRYRLEKNSGSFQSKCFSHSERNVLFSFASGKTCHGHRNSSRYMHSYLFLRAVMIALIEGRKITLVHTQTDNLACTFSMVFQAMHFTGKHGISDKAASLCPLVAVCSHQMTSQQLFHFQTCWAKLSIDPVKFYKGQ